MAVKVTNGIIVLSQCLLVFFVGTVAVWYFVTPYLVRPHPQFKQDFDEYISKHQQKEGRGLVENWTKWRLHLDFPDGKNLTLHQFQSASLNDVDGRVNAVFEWRKEYKSQLFKDTNGALRVEHELPWYSQMGLYNHFYTEEKEGKVLFLPKFMFGVRNEILNEMYDKGVSIPIIGMMTDKTSTDRLYVQCFMNLVTLSLVFMLWANNAPRIEDEFMYI